MQQEQTVVHVDIANSSAGLTIGTHIRQLVVLAKGLATAGRTNTACDIEFLCYDVIPDTIDGIDITLIAREGSHIGHTSIHIASTDSITGL